MESTSQSQAAVLDNQVRIALYRYAVERQELPTAGQLAQLMEYTEHSIAQSFIRLADSHVIVLLSDGRVRMAMPFSGVPTSFRVSRGAVWWWANCAWDALGIPAALDGGETHAEIETRCGDCAEHIRLRVQNERVHPVTPTERPVVHFALPAARWWEDIVFT